MNGEIEVKQRSVEFQSPREEQERVSEIFSHQGSIWYQVVLLGASGLLRIRILLGEQRRRIMACRGGVVSPPAVTGHPVLLS